MSVSPNDFHRRAFEEMLEEKAVSFGNRVGSGVSALLDPFRLPVMFMPGPIGYAIRRFYYRKLKSLGKNCILDIGLHITGARNISIGEYTWIDAYTTLSGLSGPITIGKRIHIAPFSIILAGPEGVEIQDYAAVGAGCQIYGYTDTDEIFFKNGKHITPHMNPWRYATFNSGPVILEKDSLLGANSVVYPGVTIGEGAVVGAGSVITNDIPPWCISVGTPPKLIGKRDKVTVPDI